MIKDVQEGLDRYKITVKKYKKFTDAIKKKYDTIHGKGNWSVLENVLKEDYDEVCAREAKLYAMEEVLRLSKREVVRIEKELGIERKNLAVRSSK